MTDIYDISGRSFVNKASDCLVTRRGSSRGYVFGSLGFRIVTEK
ncbi:MAG: hypothetical protein Q4E58_07645 [Prevotellaceae bacterium]|nr:hypothetical protein [Prevotellaceae bacterium]